MGTCSTAADTGALTLVRLDHLKLRLRLRRYLSFLSQSRRARLGLQAWQWAVPFV